MTTANLHRNAQGGITPAEVGNRRGRVAAMMWLAGRYLVSRRVPMALAVLVAFSAILGAALHWHWYIAGGTAAKLFIPLTLEAGAAAVAAVATYGPFGEAERAAGRWLPWLRLGTAVALVTVAFGVFAVASTAGRMPGGTIALLRNLGGMTGLGLLSAAAVGGAFGWTGPMAFLLLSEGALARRSTTPWVWSTRSPHDLGGAICAFLVLVAGLALITIRGPREPERNSDVVN
jgi:hypothetical protein